MPTNNNKKKTVSELIQKTVSLKQESLLEHEAEIVAKEYGINVPISGVAKSEKEAQSLARKLGAPLVMKIISPDILHKSDARAVKTDISSPKDAANAYREILRNARKAKQGAKLEGVLVQKMAPKAQEFVVGGTRDPQFGPTLMFGLGGIYVELFKDVAFRLAPVTKDEALGMMRETKSYKLIEGFRGSVPLDAQGSANTIVKVGEMMLDHPEIKSIDINPLLIYRKGVMAVDVRIILG